MNSTSTRRPAANSPRSASNGVVPTNERREVTYRRITSAELASETYDVEFAIDGAMVAGQPLVIGGPMKVLKTSIEVDAGVACATAGKFLKKFQVNREYRTLIMSGESGMASMQEIARRACSAAGKTLADLKNLFW